MKLRRALVASAMLASAAARAAPELALEASRLDRAPVRYREASGAATRPVPVLAARRQGLSAGSAEISEIKEKIVYPFLSRSTRAVAAIVLEWHPNQPERLGIVVIFSNGDIRESALPKTPDGHYGASAYELLLAKPVP
jgi:hypothetical protein